MSNIALSKSHQKKYDLLKAFENKCNDLESLGYEVYIKGDSGETLNKWGFEEVHEPYNTSKMVVFRSIDGVSISIYLTDTLKYIKDQLSMFVFINPKDIHKIKYK